MNRLTAFLIIACFSASVACGDSQVAVLVSSQAVPAGATAQIQFSLAKPQAVAAGRLALDLDPAIFASVTAVAVFSAAGDAYGFATVNGTHVDVQFWSSSGGIGKVAGNPIVAVTVSILPAAVAGAGAAITADPTGSAWKDTRGNSFAVTVGTGRLTVGGSLAVRGVQPGAGILPAGAVVRIDGTGFSSATSVEIQAVNLASILLVSPQQIDVMLAAPTEIAGKRVRLRNADGSQADFFPSWTGDPLTTAPNDPYVNAIPILPLQSYLQAATRYGRVEAGWIALQNPNPDSVDVALELVNVAAEYQSAKVVKIPAGGSYYQNVSTLGIPLENTALVLASAPIRMLALVSSTNMYTQPPFIPLKSVAPLTAANVGPRRLNVIPDSLAWTSQPNAAGPGSQTFTVYTPPADQPSDFIVAATTASGGKWLSATPHNGTTCAITDSNCKSPAIAASVDPVGLAPGIYRGSIIVTPVATTVRPDVQPSLVAVALTVTAVSPAINTVSYHQSFISPGPPGYTPSNTYNIGADLFPGSFSVSVLTDSGVNWLSATPSTAVAPATITVSADLTRLGPGRFSGEVILTGSGNTMVIPTEAFVYSGIQLSADYPGGNLRFAVRAGDAAPPAQVANVTAECFITGCAQVGNVGVVPFTASVKTNSGGNWLAAAVSAGSLSATANPAGLAPGVYTGAITLTSARAAGPTQIPVSLTIWTGSLPALTASPSVLSGSDQVCVKAGSATVTFDATASTTDGGNWLSIALVDPVTLSCGLAVKVDTAKLSPGTHTGSVLVTIPGQSLSIPVTVFVPAQPPPLLGSVVNAASAVEGPIAAREIITIHGAGLTPPVLIDGAAAQVLYSSDSQINAVVPDGVAGTRSVTIGGWGLPVAPAAPAVFTLDATGQGAAAVLNQDNSVNAPSNPAAQGSVIQIFSTGINQAAGLPVKVMIGGIDAFVQYAGQAPGAVAGLYQVNAVVPASVTTGAAVEIVISAGSLRSPGGVTIAVQ